MKCFFQTINDEQLAASTHNLSTVHHYLLKIIHRLEISMP
ncbi:hypothetical protein HMPREF2533_04054 [Bacteroides fragilis]|nr:hypothetical protein HMPREF2530_04054 [Bacteroides fragilis]KXU41556.1 hypothetical protein HMPREF2533_04054 [Bacteroides fragilis]